MSSPAARRPLLLAVDDNPDVRELLVRDLLARYGDRYATEVVSSGERAIERLTSAQASGEAVALVLADQRMPRLDGRRVLVHTRSTLPNAKRLLLGLPDDDEVILEAVGAGIAHDFLRKPWDRPGERAFPVMDDLLADWEVMGRPAADGNVRVVSTRWSPEGHQIRSFLGRYQVSYRWLDAEEDEEGRRLATRDGAAAGGLPLAVFPDGTVLSRPSMTELAEHIGAQTRAPQSFFDLLVIGGGPAGLAAAVYGASEGLTTALIERDAPGGQAGESSRIENYLGFPAGLSGSDLTRRAVAQARRFGAKLLAPLEVMGVRAQDAYQVATLGDGTELTCGALIVASGVAYRTLDVPGVAGVTGAGVFYGSAVTEAFSCVGDDVFIVGGANSAGQAAVHLAPVARSVTLLVRGEGLSASMSRYLIDQIDELSNVRIWPRRQVVAVEGALHLESITVRHLDTGLEEAHHAAGLFVFIGAQPHTDWLASSGVVRDAHGFILTGPAIRQRGVLPPAWTLEREPFLLETSVPGIFAAGDVRSGSVKRIASGVGEGAMAVAFVHRFLSG